jgi:ribosomal protein S18 acetylase RimI-like enzyme
MVRTVEVRPARADEIDAVRELIGEYRAWLNLDLAFQEIDEELDGLPGDYAPPDGALLVGLVDGRLAGMIACRRLSPGVCEMKRLYVRPFARGCGLARALIARLEDEARRGGYREIYLDTLPNMGKAQRLYETLGFVDTTPYYDTPIAGTRFMRKALGQ